MLCAILTGVEGTQNGESGWICAGYFNGYVYRFIARLKEIGMSWKEAQALRLERCKLWADVKEATPHKLGKHGPIRLAVNKHNLDLLEQLDAAYSATGIRSTRLNRICTIKIPKTDFINLDFKRRIDNNEFAGKVILVE